MGQVTPIEVEALNGAIAHLSSTSERPLLTASSLRGISTRMAMEVSEVNRNIYMSADVCAGLYKKDLSPGSYLFIP